jgi:hypothetical protein
MVASQKMIKENEPGKLWWGYVTSLRGTRHLSNPIIEIEGEEYDAYAIPQGIRNVVRYNEKVQFKFDVVGKSLKLTHLKILESDTTYYGKDKKDKKKDVGVTTLLLNTTPEVAAGFGDDMLVGVDADGRMKLSRVLRDCLHSATKIYEVSQTFSDTSKTSEEAADEVMKVAIKLAKFVDLNSTKILTHPAPEEIVETVEEPHVVTTEEVIQTKEKPIVKVDGAIA